MAKKTKKKRTIRGGLIWLRETGVKWASRTVMAIVGVMLLFAAVYRFVDPPLTTLMFTEKRRLGAITQDWVPMEQISPHLARAVVAAEDANFCLHWGFDINAIRDAARNGAERGASTVTQQVVKNVYLWPARSWFRKALEALITPVVELVWPKRRVLEVYLNVAEFGEGVFGASAAARKYFKVQASELTLQQAALLAAVLPNPKARSAVAPTDFIRKRAADIADGAETIKADGRSGCFED